MEGCLSAIEFEEIYSFSNNHCGDEYCCNVAVDNDGS